MITTLTNPWILRAAIVLFAAVCAFVFAVVVMRRLRNSIAAEAEIDSAAAPTLEGLPIHLYNTVIQQLTQQKHELQAQTQAEQRRARTSENLSQAVVANLSCGVLVFGMNGLVKQANPSGREMLGFQALTGMSAEDIFRDAAVDSPESGGVYGDGMESFPVTVAEEVQAVLREGCQRRHFEAGYSTPAGAKLHLAMTVSAVPAVDGSLLGVACVISDRSEFEKIRRQQQLQGEISAEMALELRTSLATIAGYAQQLAKSRDLELAPRLAADIAEETAILDRRIGGFLTEKSPANSGFCAAVAVRSQ